MMKQMKYLPMIFFPGFVACGDSAPTKSEEDASALNEAIVVVEDLAKAIQIDHDLEARSAGFLSPGTQFQSFGELNCCILATLLATKICNCLLSVCNQQRTF